MKATARRFHKTGPFGRQAPTFATSVEAAGCQVVINAPGLESVGGVFIPQLSAADQRDRGHTWGERRSGISQVGLLQTLQMDLGRHGRDLQGATAEVPALVLLRPRRGSLGE